MKLHTKTFKTYKEAEKYKEKINKDTKLLDVKIWSSNYLENHQPSKWQVRTIQL